MAIANTGLYAVEDTIIGPEKARKGKSKIMGIPSRFALKSPIVLNGGNVGA